VAPKAGLPAAQFDKLLRGHGAKSARKLNGINVYVVDLSDQSRGQEKALARALAQNPNIKFAEVDGAIEMQQTPSDPYLGSEWHLSKIGAPDAWDTSTGSGVTIAILDGGVESGHPDLAARMVPGWNFYDNNSNTVDINGHGTMVAGVAAAAGNNGIGVAGVAWNAKIMPMRISDPNGNLTYYSIVANSLTWAADHGARVANISYIVSHIATVQNAAQYMRNKGGLVVASAGNTGAYNSSPNTPTIITAAATDSSDVRASWSAYGPIVDVAAPGVGIWTTTPGGNYGPVNGTSFSSPLTAGVVALILSANPSLSPSQVDNILTSTADDLLPAGRDDYYGYGRINAARAVAAARGVATVDSQPPTVSILSPSGGTLGGIVSVEVEAKDNIGVTRTELYVNGALHASDIAAPYSFSLDTSTLSDGNVALIAKAYDQAGNLGTSSVVNLTVANNNTVSVPSTGVSSALGVSISNPSDGASVNGNVNIGVTTSDGGLVPSLSLYIDGTLMASGRGSISYKWNARKASNGPHTIQAVAKDGNNATASQTIRVMK
jgi:subtilisin family serine protease